MTCLFNSTFYGLLMLAAGVGGLLVWIALRALCQDQRADEARIIEAAKLGGLVVLSEARKAAQGKGVDDAHVR